MKEADAVDLLQMYRHDMVNHMQLIHGYLAMNQPERAKQKLNEWISLCEQERRLTSLHAPKFALWVIRCNTIYNRLDLTYHIHSGKKSLSAYDDALKQLCEAITSILYSELPEHTLQKIVLEVDDTKAETLFCFSIIGTFAKDASLLSAIHDLKAPFSKEINHTAEVITCHFLIPNHF